MDTNMTPRHCRSCGQEITGEIIAKMSQIAKIEILIDYIKIKLAERDWHAVRDACVDIEILEALGKNLPTA